MSTNIRITNKDWSAGYPQKIDTAVRNLAGIVVQEQAKIAPFRSGALVSTGRVVKNSDANYSASFGGIKPKVGDTDRIVDYAAMRNENSRRPHYMETGAANAINGNPQRWWGKTS